MQEWVKASGAKVLIAFEGRDTAGKGGTIKAITERVSPRVFRVVALPAPTERERSQMYIQRYIPHFPAAGEVVIFDRSWYNRAGVERVMGFCTEEQSARFLEQVPAVEKAMVDSGHHPAQVLARGQSRRADSPPRESHRRSAEDLEALRHGPRVLPRWNDYTRARDDMFAATDTAWAPWFVAHSDDKRSARLNVITHLLSQIPYEAPRRKKVDVARAKSARRASARRHASSLHPHALHSPPRYLGVVADPGAHPNDDRGGGARPRSRGLQRWRRYRSGVFFTDDHGGAAGSQAPRDRTGGTHDDPGPRAAGTPTRRRR